MDIYEGSSEELDKKMKEFATRLERIKKEVEVIRKYKEPWEFPWFL